MMEIDISAAAGGINHNYLNGMRIGEAKHPGPAATFAVPTREQASESAAAACAYYASVVVPWLEGHPEHPMMWACQTCGINTGNWCNQCQLDGTSPVTWGGLEGRGAATPMCDTCQSENRRCHYCGVRGGGHTRQRLDACERLLGVPGSVHQSIWQHLSDSRS